MTDYKVETGAAALPSGASVTSDLFVVSGGRVIVKRLLGVTTTSTSATGNINIQVDGAVTVTGLGGFSPNGAPAGYSFTTAGAAWVPSGALDIVLNTGEVVQLAAAGTTSGSAAWTLVYEPLDPGAKVEAA